MLESCKRHDDAKLVLDLVSLFKNDVADTNSIQVEIIRNLVGKLKSKNNHKYVDIMKDISAMHKNKLGTQNYSILADVFGLASPSTCDMHVKTELKLKPGVNYDVIEKSVAVYQSKPVIECSDEARALCFIDARLSEDGAVELLGNCFDADIDQWTESRLLIPEKAPNDIDQFTTLKDLVYHLISSEKLAKSVSAHNFTSLCSVDLPDIIYCHWLTPNVRYKAKHLLKIQH